MTTHDELVRLAEEAHRGVARTYGGYAPIDKVAEAVVAAIEPEMDAMRAVITEAALETYEPDGAEIVASHMIQQQQEIAELRRMVAAARAEGWDEGYYRGTRDAESDQEPADNPYRTEESR